MRISLVIATVLAVAGCQERVRVTVECETVTGPAVHCDVHQVEGKSEVDVCWDFSVTCKNGTTITPPRSCTKVKDGGTTRYVIDKDKLANADKCDGEPRAQVTKLTMNGKPAE